MSVRTVVVGAGLSGLAAALASVRRGDETVLLEASDRPGGVVRSERRAGYLLELGPNTVRPTREIAALVRELGLENEAVYADARLPRYVDFGGTLQAVPMSPGGLLGTRLLSLGGKLRILMEPLIRARRSDESDESDESVRDFVARRLGPQVAERLVEPFVGGVFAGDARRLSVAAAFPVLAGWERRHGSLFAGALAARRAARGSNADADALPKGLLSFRDGVEALPRALAARLGETLRLRSAVEGLAPDTAKTAGRGWTLVAAGTELSADRVILTLPAPRAAAIVSSFAPEAARALAAIPYPPLALLHLAWEERALRRPLAGFGQLVAPSPNRRILGAVWSSSLFAGRAPAGRALLTVFLGGTRDPGALALSDDALVAAATKDLEEEGLIHGPPEVVRITRWEAAIPQYERGHVRAVSVLAETERRWPGLHFRGNYRGGISVGDVVRQGLAAGASDGATPQS
jgi:oxygen-dependent protoporphyrinogen oxidase